METDLLAVLVTVAGSVLAGTIATIGVVVSGQCRLADRLGGIEQRVSRLEGMLSTLQALLLRGRGHEQSTA